MQTITMITSTLFACSVVLTGCGSDGTVPLSATKQWRSQHFDVSQPRLPMDGGKHTSPRLATPSTVRTNFWWRSRTIQVRTVTSSKWKRMCRSSNSRLKTTLMSTVVSTRRILRMNWSMRATSTFMGIGSTDFRFKATGTKGATSMYVHIFRNGHQMIGVQWVFPISGDGAIEVPQDISNFDKGVTDRGGQTI